MTGRDFSGRKQLTLLPEQLTLLLELKTALVHALILSP